MKALFTLPVVCLFASSMIADIISQTVSLPSVVTDVTNRAATCNLFGSADAPHGSTWSGVTLEWSISECLNSLLLQNFKSASFTADDTINAAVGIALSNALISASTAQVVFVLRGLVHPPLREAFCQKR